MKQILIYLFIILPFALKFAHAYENECFFELEEVSYVLNQNDCELSLIITQDSDDLSLTIDDEPVEIAECFSGADYLPSSDEVNEFGDTLINEYSRDILGRNLYLATVKFDEIDDSIASEFVLSMNGEIETERAIVPSFKGPDRYSAGFVTLDFRYLDPIMYLWMGESELKFRGNCLGPKFF